MEQFIEKLIGRLEEEKKEAKMVACTLRNIVLDEAIEIVNQVAEEHEKDQNWQTTRNYLDEKYFSKIRELSAKYNHPCENVPINFDWVFGLIEKIEKAAAVEDSGWIPCSERLPKETEQERTVYDPITLAEVDIEKYTASDLVNVTVRHYDSDEFFVSDDCTVDGKWVNFDGEEYDVIAWQPLPAPFEKKENNMAKCKYPNEACANMKFFHGNTYCDSVPCVLKEELPKPSNADKIRAMSDEELAEFFSERDKIPNRYKCKEIEDWIKWLQSDAE